MDIRNNGPGGVQDLLVRVSFDLDRLATVTSVDAPEGTTYDAETGEWFVTTLPVGDVQTLRIEVDVARTPARPGRLAVTAEVIDSGQERLKTSDDHDTETTRIVPGRRPAKRP